MPEGRKGRGFSEKGKGLRSTNRQLQNGHRDAKYSIGNITNNIAITLYGGRNIGVKSKRFCTAKEAINKRKIQSTNSEKIFINDKSDKELICKIYKDLLQT